MCGISGYATLRARDTLSGVLRSLNEQIRHRGPDDEGYFEAGGVGLGMRRLSIVDIAGSHQPIANEDGTVHVIFNGEIYNYVELRAELQAKGHRLATAGDTEVLVHLYEEHGLEMLHRLRGMFAFALWDAQRKRLFLARDRLGKKPLCYSLVDNDLIFCSEIHPLAHCAMIPREIDPCALASYLTSGYISAPRTVYAAIRKLPPAHFLVWEAGEIQIRKYWRLDHRTKIACDYGEAKELVRARIDDSIRIRLRSDVPLGLLLSGGIDSNAILARATAGLGQKLKTFTIGFGEKRYDESDLAAISARHFGTDHHELRAEANLLGLLPKVIRHYGEPFADKSALPSLLVCELTRTQAKVALNGDGGDEAFAGYRKYRLKRWQKRVSALARGRWRQRWASTSLRGAGLFGTRPGRSLRRSLLPETESLFTTEFFTGSHFAALTTKELRAHALTPLDAALEPFWAEDASVDAVDRMLAWDYSHYLADDLLVKMDIASMANSIEMRSPFLDHELVELCASLPSEWKVDSRQGKRLLREIVAPDLPAEVLQAPKRGFSVPLEEWWRGDARKPIRESLESLHPALVSFIKPEYGIRLLDQHQRAGRNHAQRLWCLWVLNGWAWENLGK
jgi:asparagine synthase (glutamine-hydrolysing)